jgi:hypothetical protein
MEVTELPTDNHVAHRWVHASPPAAVLRRLGSGNKVLHLHECRVGKGKVTERKEATPLGDPLQQLDGGSIPRIFPLERRVPPRRNPSRLIKPSFPSKSKRWQGSSPFCGRRTKKIGATVWIIIYQSSDVSSKVCIRCTYSMSVLLLFVCFGRHFTHSGNFAYLSSLLLPRFVS